MRNFFKFMLFSFILNACGDGVLSKRKSIDGEEGSITILKTGTPKVYQLADSSCTQPLKDLGKVKIWGTKNRKVQLVEVDLTGFSGSGLKSESVQSVQYGQEIFFADSCEEVGSELYCKKPTIEIPEGKEIQICRVGGEYPRQSLENVALATVAGIHQAHKFYQSLNQDKKLDKIEVYVHPIVKVHLNQTSFTDGKKDILKRTEILTDGAFYSRKNPQLGFIAAIPQSEKGDLVFPSAMWETLGVMSHEYGHHIFHSFAPQAVEDDSHSHLPIHFIDKPIVRVKKVLNAINEGFADLISHLSFDSGRHPLGGLDYLGIKNETRNISSTSFNNGSPKMITEPIMNIFLELTPPIETTDDAPDYHEIHQFGAIVGHGFYRFNTHKYKLRQPSSASSKEQFIAQELLNWADHIQNHFVNDKTLSPRKYFDSTLLAQLQNQNPEKTLSKSQCTVIHHVFPIFKNQFTCEY